MPVFQDAGHARCRFAVAGPHQAAPERLRAELAKLADVRNAAVEGGNED